MSQNSKFSVESSGGESQFGNKLPKGLSQEQAQNAGIDNGSEPVINDPNDVINQQLQAMQDKFKSDSSGR